MSNNFRYAIFGGTFDPVHNGHIRLAKEAVKQLSLDKLYFMPNYISPFKTDRQVSPQEHRFAMLEEIAKKDKAFSVSDYEIKRSGPSYTYNTLDYFEKNIDGKLYFLMGFDSLVSLDTWYRGVDLIKRFSIVTGKRPGTSDSDGLSKLAFYRKEYGADITLLDVEPYDASSTEIKEMIKNGEPLDKILAPEVQKYIVLHKLYR